MPGTVTVVQIANSALIKLNCDRISDIDEDTKPAIIIKAGYALWRDSTLRAHPWKFALTRAVLAPNSTTPAFEYDYAYDLPNDHLRTWEVVDSFGNDDILWTEEGTTILTNETSIGLRYVKYGTDESTWDAMFCEAFAWQIARNIAFAMTENASLVDLANKGYKDILAEARSVSGMSGIMKGITADRWTNARRGRSLGTGN